MLSQIISFGMFFNFYFINKKTGLSIHLSHFKPDFLIIRDIVLIGLPALIQMLSFAVTVVLLNNVLGRFDEGTSIGTYGIAIKVVGFLMIPLQGMVHGIQPIFGYNFGAMKIRRVFETLNLSSVLAGIYGCVITIVIFLFSEPLMILFSNERDVIELGSRILRIICLGMAFSGVHMMQTTFFSGIGKVKASVFLSLSSNVLCLIPTLLLLSKVFGDSGVWWSFPISNLLTLILSWSLILVEKRKYEVNLLMSDSYVERGGGSLGT